MKKLFIFLLALLFVAPAWAKTEHPISYQLAEAIGASNYKKVQKLLPQLRDNKKDRLRKHLFFIASYVCLPDSPIIVNDSSLYYYFPKEIKPVCKKKENAEIIELLLADDNKDDVSLILHYKEGTESNGNIAGVSFLTPLHYLKMSRPDLIPQIAEKLDPCTVALTQMQELTPEDQYYYTYADFYRDNQCATQDDDYIELDNKKPGKVGFGSRYASWTDGYGNLSSEQLKEYGKWALDIGKTKLDLLEEMGMPAYYETPSEFREIITFRKVKMDEFITGVYDYIYTLDRDVITKIERKYLGMESTADVYKKDFVFDENDADVMKKYETEERGY